jgi:Uma2 family endonuclease
VTSDFVIGEPSRAAGVSEAADVVLACEIASPSSTDGDHSDKMALYAAAGIEWYLRPEPDTSDYVAVDLRLYRLDGASYAEHAAAGYGQVLRSGKPFPIEVPTDRLTRP